MAEEIFVRFYLTTGESIRAFFTQEKFKELERSLAKSWNTCTTIGDTFSLNFAHVTHYIVESKENS